MMKYFSLIIMAWICGQSFLIGQNYCFEKISPESGFVYSSINTINEDCNGMVWFGSNDGLYYYNTSTVEKIELVESTSVAYESHSVQINKIQKDSSCNIWVCTKKGLFKRNISDDKFTRVLLNNDSINISKSNIESIVQFKEDLFYIIINDTLYYFNTDDFVLNKVNIAQELTTSISFIDIDENQNLIVGTGNGKVYIGTSPYANFKLLFEADQYKINTICRHNNNYFVGYENNGVVVINKQGQKIQEYNYTIKGNHHLPDNHVRDIVKTNNGDIWIATFKGILVIGAYENKIITSNQNTGLPFNSIYALHKGVNGGIWVGTWTGGLAYYRNDNYRFHHIKKVPNESTESKSIISSFLQDKTGNIWIGSEQSGLSIFSISNNKFKTDNQILPQNSLKGVKTFTSANGNDIYIGTIFQGIWHYNLTTKKLQKINYTPPVESTVISTMAFNNNELWIATRTNGLGLTNYNIKTNVYTAYPLPQNNNGDNNNLIWVWKLLFDSTNRLWICTEDGLLYKDKDNENLMRCFKNDTTYNLNNSFIYTIFEDSRKNIWVGTRGKGIFQYSLPSKEIKHIGENDKTLCCSDVYGIVQDKQENMWISTNNGIYKYNINSNSTIHYSVFDGISGNQFIPNAIYSCKNGEIFFGSSNGFCFINPQEIKMNTVIPKPFISKLFINNKPFNQLKDITSNSQLVSKLERITLKHHQNSITLGVVANNFIKPEKNRFRYRLINYQNKWVETKQNKDITFTKIPTGKYTLEILASNNDAIWSKTPLVIQIEILAPIWKRWYAILLYLVLTLALASIIWRELNQKIILRKEIITEKYKGETNNEIFEEKVRFFTNISHEIRTPLTLILSPLNNLLSQFKYDEKTTKHLLLIKRNSSRLLRLTNQLLDFRLLEVGKLRANFQKYDIVSVCKDVLNCFEHLVIEKQINFIFNSSYKSMRVTIDPDMIEKIIYNLVSNALKFSEEKGQIFLSIENKELTAESYHNYICKGNYFIGKSIEIKVRDYGIGIKPDLLPLIFDRFTFSQDKTKTGSGIGLHLCQEYTKLNNGNLLVSSIEDKGSIFILNIPIDKNSAYEKENIVSQFSLQNNDDKNIENDFNSSENVNKPIILLTEDNDELRSYLKVALTKHYKVLTAKNGQQAFEIANEVIPDLLISDILMPVVNGIELTQKIKSNKKTSEIPIVILTALSESKYQKESLLEGVDSYLIKPIDETLLLAQIQNILIKRKKVSSNQEIQKGKQQNLELLVSEIPLIKKVEQLVVLNLRDSDFCIENILNILNISKSTLHRKIKHATNQSPTEYIRDIRISNAVKLMKSDNYNIDEIATLVGFNSTSYFIRSFKKKYGITPREYSLKISGNKKD